MRIAEPLALFFTSLLHHLLLCLSRLCVGCCSLPLPFAGSSLAVGVRLRCAYSRGPVWSTRCHETWQSDKARDNVPALEVGMLKRSIPRRYTLHWQTNARLGWGYFALCIFSPLSLSLFPPLYKRASLLTRNPIFLLHDTTAPHIARQHTTHSHT